MKHLKKFYLVENLSADTKRDFLEMMAKTWSEVNEWERVEVDYDRGCIVGEYGPFEVDWYTITTIGNGFYSNRIEHTPVHHNKITVYPDWNEDAETEDVNFLRQIGLTDVGVVKGFKLVIETLVSIGSYWTKTYTFETYEPAPEDGENYWNEVYKEIANRYTEEPMSPDDVDDDYSEWWEKY